MRACYDWHLWWNQTNMWGIATSDGSVLDTPQVIVPEALRRCPRVPGVWGWCMLALGNGERSAGAQGGANICAGLHTHWLYCQPYTKKQLPGLTCVQTIIFPLLLLGVTYLCQTTLRGIVVPKSYNYKCNSDQSNALCAIKHYVRWPSAPHSHGHHDHHHTPNPFSDCHAKWCVEYQAAIPHPSSPSTILIHLSSYSSSFFWLWCKVVCIIHTVYIKQLLRQVVTSGPATRLPPRLLTLTNVVQVIIIISIVFIISFSFLSTEKIQMNLMNNLKRYIIDTI